MEGLLAKNFFVLDFAHNDRWLGPLWQKEWDPATSCIWTVFFRSCVPTVCSQASASAILLTSLAVPSAL